MSPALCAVSGGAIGAILSFLLVSMSASVNPMEERTFVVSVTDDGRLAGYVLLNGLLSVAQAQAELDKNQLAYPAKVRVAWPVVGRFGRFQDR